MNDGNIEFQSINSFLVKISSFSFGKKARNMIAVKIKKWWNAKVKSSKAELKVT